LDRGALILKGSPKQVTAQYQRFLFARPQNVSRIRNEIITMIPNISSLNDSSKPDHNESLLQKNDLKNENKIETTAIKEQSSRLQPLYAGNLIPKSTIEYKNYDVTIGGQKIETLRGMEVNILVMRQKYVYSYNIKFGIDAEDVGFGVKFKTEKGSVIGGAGSQAMKKYVLHATAGDEFFVKWYFKCILLPGNYYTNIGVTAKINEERIILNRITDSLIFKVQSAKNTGYSGIVNFDFYPEVIKTN
jgi:lipopolysaccharide transport system ATP-binding protein